MKQIEQSFNSTLKMGSCELKRRPLKHISYKRATQNRKYFQLKTDLLRDCLAFGGGKAFRSELDGELTDQIEFHHIDSRRGERLIDPMNIIVLTPEQHRCETAHHSFERIQQLKAIVRPIRLKQGYKEQV